MTVRRKKLLGGASLVLMLLLPVLFRLLRFEQGHLRWAGEQITRIVNKPYFHIGSFALTPITLLESVVYALLLGLAARLSGKLLERHVLVYTHLNEGQKYDIRRVTQYLIFFFGIVIGLESIGLSLSSLTIFSGAVGIGIGFGLQETANNFVSGLILLFEHPIKVGDRVEMGGIDGRVERIGARSTWIRTNDNIVIVVPNSQFITKEVINWTANNREVRFLVPFGVSYNSDPEQVRDVVLDVARTHPYVLDHPAPDVIFTGFGDSSIDFELRVWTSTQVHRRPILRSDLYFAMFRAFREHGIEIPFPQHDLHLRSAEAAIALRPPPPNGDDVPNRGDHALP